MIARDLSKQQALNANSRAVLKLNFTVIVDRAGNTRMFLFNS